MGRSLSTAPSMVLCMDTTCGLDEVVPIYENGRREMTKERKERVLVGARKTEIDFRDPHLSEGHEQRFVCGSTEP